MQNEILFYFFFCQHHILRFIPLHRINIFSAIVRDWLKLRHLIFELEFLHFQKMHFT